jgi:uncharacterized membrane protein
MGNMPASLVNYPADGSTTIGFVPKKSNDFCQAVCTLTVSLREERDVFVRKHLVSDQRLFFLPPP